MEGSPISSTQTKRLASYMHEIDGVRGIALTLVVLFHVFGQGRVSGGVDVFLVISAYFLTRKLLKHSANDLPESTARQQATWLSRHFVHVFTRLVPSAALVLIAVLGATLLVSPASVHLQNIREIVASALYYENWELIWSQLSYGAAGPDASPLQHFWSLSVQGQFFIAWPLLAFALFAVARRVGCRFHTAFVVVISLLTLVSFVWAILSVQQDQPVAYFSTFARFWELGVGALVAFIPSGFLARGWVREGAVWIGIALIVATGFIVDGGSLYPGLATLLPVGATVLVLIGASRGAEPGFASRAMSVAPIRFLSRISYALYLWHWPILVFYMQYQDYDKVGWKGALLVLGVSAVLATMTELIVGRRMLDWSSGLSLPKRIAAPVVPIVMVLVLSMATFSMQSAAQAEALRKASQPSPDHIGAEALLDPKAAANLSDDVDFIPSVEAAFGDFPTIYAAPRCIQNHRNEAGMDEVLVCDRDDYGARKTVVLGGGSKAVQWYPALQIVAKNNGWRLIVIDKDGCRMTTATDASVSSTCQAWNAAAPDVIASYEPDAVFTVATVASPGPEQPEAIPEGRIDFWESLDEKGIPVVAVRDTPRFPFKVPECLEQNGLQTESCSKLRADAFDADLFDSDPELADKYHFIDLTDAVCGPVVCEPIIGNILSYRDVHHLTATYAKTLAPALEEALREQMPSLF